MELFGMICLGLACFGAIVCLGDTLFRVGVQLGKQLTEEDRRKERHEGYIKGREDGIEAAWPKARKEGWMEALQMVVDLIAETDAGDDSLFVDGD